MWLPSFWSFPAFVYYFLLCSGGGSLRILIDRLSFLPRATLGEATRNKGLSLSNRIKALVLVFTVGRLEAPVHLGSYVYTIFLPHFGQKCYRENLSYASAPQGVPRVLYAIQKPHTFFNIAISLQGHTYQAACIPLGLGIGISRSQLQFLMSTSRKRYTSSGIEKKVLHLDIWLQLKHPRFGRESFNLLY